MTATFSKPVHVLVGLGHILKIERVLEALRFLDDCPGDCREKRYAAATCRAALAGRADVHSARMALIAFAQKRDMLVELTDAETMGFGAIQAQRPAPRTKFDS